MSRENKLRKKQRQRQRGVARKPKNLTLNPVVKLARPGPALRSYYLTEGPLEVASENSEAFYQIPKMTLDAAQKLMRTDPKAAIERLRELIAEYPEAHRLRQWLWAVLDVDKRYEEADRLAEENYRRQPDYLFARTSYAWTLLRRNDLDGVDRVLGHQFDLKGMYPDRDTFHVSELMSLSRVMIEYWIKRGKLETAIMYGKMIVEAAPDQPVTLEAIRKLKNAVAAEKLKLMVTESLCRGFIP